MDKRKSSATAASGSSSSSTTNKSNESSSFSYAASEPVVAVDTTTTNQDAMLSQRVHRVLQNYLLVWLDANMDESKKDFKNALKRLRHIVTSITIFTNARQCIDFIREINNEKVFMIVSGSLGQHILPTIHEWPQLDSVYVFCRKQSVHEQWAKTMSKVKGVHNHAKLICEALQIDCERCDQAMISMSFRGIDVSFMYTQLFKEAFLKIDYDDTKSIQELVEYCRLQDDIPEDEIKKIEQNYRDHTPIWWYTAPYFIYSMLNRGLRMLDIDIILKIGFFIRHLYEDMSCSETMHPCIYMKSCRLSFTYDWSVVVLLNDKPMKSCLIAFLY
ncbi:unnamed protein product [Rotaria sp. Silwood1]|nr:unnamed protein product [Rotaria sp. Silwood1]